MWLKVHYPVEFFAGVMTMVKEERRDAVLTDMRRMGVTLLPPDINISEQHFTALNDTTLIAPFSALKGLTDRSTKAIIEARGVTPFTSLEDFQKRVPGKFCNSKQRDILDAVGAFARIIPGQPDATDPSRRASQVEWMPGLVADAVVIDRPLEMTAPKLRDLVNLIDDFRHCVRCELAGACHPKPKLGKSAQAFLVLDGPNFKEESFDEMGHGSHAVAIETALNEIDLGMEDVYLTSLIKTIKPDKQKTWPMKTLTECPIWLEGEMNLLKPPVVVILGSQTFKHFFPSLKGGINEHTGKVIYDKGRGLNFLIGINPNAIYFDASKQILLNQTIAKLQELLPVA
jgi:DNA polymerase-3 subunit alpha